MYIIQHKQWTKISRLEETKERSSNAHYYLAQREKEVFMYALHKCHSILLHFLSYNLFIYFYHITHLSVYFFGLFFSLSLLYVKIVV